VEASSAKRAEKEERKAKKEAAKLAKAEKACMPKRPRSSYLFFCDETRDTLKRSHPDLSVIDLAKLQGAQWKDLPEPDKQRYVDKAAADVERFKAEMEAGGWYEKEREMKRAEEERRAAAGEEPPSKKHKSPSPSAGRSRKKSKVFEWFLPEGYMQAPEPPTAAQLEFGNTAGDALVGKHILFNWDGVGWCEGVIDSRNTDPSALMDEDASDVVNFVVYYEIDDDHSQHNLELHMYGGGPDADFDNWVLLELVSSTGVEGAAAADGGAEASGEAAADEDEAAAPSAPEAAVKSGA